MRAMPGSSSEYDGVEGNQDVQDALMQQLRVQIENQTLKEEIRDDLKGKVEGIKQISDELLEQLDAELDIEKFRAELESSQVLSEANEKFNELEEQLQQIKDQIKADQADVRAFETSSAAARSQGLFFKNLYQPPAEEDENGVSSSSSSEPLSSTNASIRKPLLDPAGTRQAAAIVTSSAEEEVSSPFRMYLFGYMAAVLVLVVMQDVSGAAPNYGLDGLYGALALLLGVNSFHERKALVAVISSKQSMPSRTADSRGQGGTETKANCEEGHE
eukprot:gene12765-12894_t